MKPFHFQLIEQPDVWAATIYFLWIFNVGVVIQNTGNRSDIFLTVGAMPVTLTIAIGLQHLL